MKKAAVLVIGSGGREHAIVRSLSISPSVEKIYAAPGNPGIGLLAELVPVDVNNHADILRFVKEKEIALTVIGPEGPLVAGLSDALRAQNHLVVGASRAAAQLEGSKLFAKEFMFKYGIPTANYRMFTDAEAAKRFVRSAEGANYRVIKADGLAAGKGVFVTKTAEDAVRAIHAIMEEKKFGGAGDKIIIEEKMIGAEVSVMAFTDGQTVLPLPASQDHKRLQDQDRGPNTGGMGAYAPTPLYDESVRHKADRDVIENFVRGLKAERLDFRGIIYFGLMLTSDGPKVLEFNVRLGDPETQVVLPLIQSDVYEVFYAIAEGKLKSIRLERKNEAACTVVLASGGYPGSFQSGLPITGLDDAEKKEGVLVFHAGTKQAGQGFVTAGGRVLNVTGFGPTIEAAVVKAYQGVKRIYFKYMHFRTDIAYQALPDKSLCQKIGRMKNRQIKEVVATHA